MDAKDYIVNYQVNANVINASQNIAALAESLTGLQTVAKPVADALRDIRAAVTQLQSASIMKFEPRMDPTLLRQDLKAMENMVAQAAARMHASIYNALANNPANQKLVQQSGIKTLTLKDLRDQVTAAEKRLKEIGSEKNSKSLISRSANAVKQAITKEEIIAAQRNYDKLLNEQENLQKLLPIYKDELKAKEKEIAKQEKEQKKAERQLQKRQVASQKQTLSGPVSTVDTKTISAWQKAFGNAKSRTLTFKLLGSAEGPKGVMTVLNNIQTKIAELQEAGTIQITPTLNTAALNGVKEQIQALAGAGVLTTPAQKLTKAEKEQLKNAKAQVKAINEKIAPIQSRYNTLTAIPEDKRTPAQKGQITKAEKALSELNAQKEQQQKIIKAFKDKAGKSGAGNAITQTINVAAKIAKITEPAKTPTILVNAKFLAAQVNKAIEAIPTPTLPVNVNLNMTTAQEQLNALAAKPLTVGTGKGTGTTGATASTTGKNTTSAPAKNPAPKTVTPPSGFMGSGKNRVFFGDQKPDAALAPKGYHWAPSNNLASRLSGAQGAAYQSALNMQAGAEKASTVLTKKLERLQKAAAKAERQEARGQKMLQQRPWAIEALNEKKANAQAQLAAIQEKLRKQQKRYKASPSEQRFYQMKETAQQFASLKKTIAGYDSQIAYWQNLPTTVANVSSQASQLRHNVATVSAQIASQKPAWDAAKATPGKFNNGYQLQENAASSGNIAKANALRTQLHNSILPFAKNKEQINMVAKHRRFFRQAMSATGITPFVGMGNDQMLKYLQGVSSQMSKASVAIPWQLQSEINKLQNSLNKVKGVSASSSSGSKTNFVAMPAEEQNFATRMRKWAYPFAGPTSFGVKTPMAVDMAKGMGVMFAIGGAMSAVGSSFSQAMEYQNTMRTTQAILQNGTDTYTQGSFKNMEATVRNVGIKTKFSAPEVANAAKFLAMAGFDIDQINAAIRPIADLALIGDADLGETADKMTNILTTFGVDAKKIKENPDIIRQYANIMATTATRTNTDVMMLAESTKYGGGVANMYGRNDPNLFADTMAIFGVMGNSGIQASSAGTSLRMMYQNIFNPNKKQAQILAHLKKDFGISTKTSDGQNRSMADIILDMANKIPADEMADIVGKLFRITAQPGANAALLSAKDIALEATGGDANTAKGLIDETNAFVNKLSGKDSKSQMSVLASLIKANRDSMNGNISGAIAEEKQNTIAGLWAQVTSTFTEGIVQAFENREDGFAGMLKKIRDYFAKPETMLMLQNLLDMIISVGKVLAWFVKIWASFYNTAPGLIKLWITAQMAFTQMGYLIGPITALVSAFSSLRVATLALAGLPAYGAAGGAAAATAAGMAAGTPAGTAAISGAAAANAALILPMFSGSDRIKGKIGGRYNSQVAQNAYLASFLALSGNNHKQTLDAMNKVTTEHYREIQARYQRRYFSWNAVGKSLVKGANGAFNFAAITSVFANLRMILFPILSGLANALGFLVNPATLALAALGGLGVYLYKLKQRIDGTTGAQIQRKNEMDRIVGQGLTEMGRDTSWYNDLYDNIISIQALPKSQADIDKQAEYDKNEKEFKRRFGWIAEDFSKNSSTPLMQSIVEKWNNFDRTTPLAMIAYGKYKDQLTGAALPDFDNSAWNNALTKFGLMDAQATDASVYNTDFEHTPEVLQKISRQKAMMIAPLYDEKIQKAIKDINELYKVKGKYTQKTGKYTPENFQKRLDDIRAKVANSFETPLSGADLIANDNFSSHIDFSKYDYFQEAALALLDAHINQQPGTYPGVLKGQETLENKLWKTQDEWYGAIEQVIGQYRVYDTFISEDGLRQANIGIQLNLLPNGQGFDLSSMKYQIESKIGSFNGSLQQYLNIITSFYSGINVTKEMLEGPSGVIQTLKDTVKNTPITELTLRDFYIKHVAHNSKSKFHGWKMDKFVEMMMQPDKVKDPYFGWFGAKKDNIISLPNGEAGLPSKFIGEIYDQLVNDSVSNLINSSEETKEKVSDTNNGTSTDPNSKNNNTNDPSNDKKTPPKTNDQSDYASHYSRNSAQPNQIVFNINNLANFDRTTIASSAEERDLMASMQSLIAETVYKMTAEALNSMGHLG